MSVRRNLYVITVAAVVIAGLVGAAALLRIPPFSDETGQIETSDVCDSLGSASQSVVALKSVLPKESSYTFQDDVTLRVNEQDDGYGSDCFVSGGGNQLMHARTQMTREAPLQSWIDDEVAQVAEGKDRLTPFPAGAEGVASPSVAAVFVPCTSVGKIPGGQYNLSVVVHLKEAGKADDADIREGLVELAKNASAFAHGKAKCDIALS